MLGGLPAGAGEKALVFTQRRPECVIARGRGSPWKATIWRALVIYHSAEAGRTLSCKAQGVHDGSHGTVGSYKDTVFKEDGGATHTTDRDGSPLLVTHQPTYQTLTLTQAALATNGVLVEMSFFSS